MGKATNRPRVESEREFQAVRAHQGVVGEQVVRRAVGDHHAVVGIGLPTLRRLVRQVGVPWHSLWAARA